MQNIKGYSRIAVRFLVVAFVVLHIQGHLTNLAVETSFMPVLETTQRESHISVLYSMSPYLVFLNKITWVGIYLGFELYVGVGY